MQSKCNCVGTKKTNKKAKTANTRRNVPRISVKFHGHDRDHDENISENRPLHISDGPEVSTTVTTKKAQFLPPPAVDTNWPCRKMFSFCQNISDKKNKKKRLHYLDTFTGFFSHSCFSAPSRSADTGAFSWVTGAAAGLPSPVFSSATSRTGGAGVESSCVGPALLGSLWAASV